MDEEKFVNNVAEIIKGSIETIEEVEGDKIYSRHLIKKIANKIKSSPAVLRPKIKKKASALFAKLKLLLGKQKVKNVTSQAQKEPDQKKQDESFDLSSSNKNDTCNVSNECASEENQSSDMQEESGGNSDKISSKRIHIYDVDCLEGDEVTDSSNLYRIIPIKGDGNCLFNSFSQFLYGTQDFHKELREEAVNYVVNNFVEEYDALFMSNPVREYKDAQHYAQIMNRIGEYGTLFEAGILRKLYNINIVIFTTDNATKHIVKRDEYIEAHNPKILHLLIIGEQNKIKDCEGREVSGLEIPEGHWVVLDKLPNNEEKLLKSHNLNTPHDSCDNHLEIEPTLTNKTDTEHEKMSHSEDMYGFEVSIGKNNSYKVESSHLNTFPVDEKYKTIESTDENTSYSYSKLPLEANADLLKLCEEAKEATEKKVKTVYSHDLGLISLPSVAFKSALGYRYADKMRAIIEDCLLKDLNCTCMMQFYGGVRKNILDFVAYAKCGHVTHDAKFKFRMHHMDETIAYIHVMSTEDIKVVHEDAVESTRYKPLKGQQRHIFVEKAELQGVQSFLDDIIDNSDRGLKCDGHMQEIRRSTVLYTAISEKNAKHRLQLQSKDLLDLYEMVIQEGKKKDPFLRSVSFPIKVIMFTEEDILIASTEAVIIVHIDATGSIARIPQYIKCKKLYYYTIVMRHKNVIIKLAQMITSEHDIASIGSWLLAYKHFTMKVLKKWPMIRALVSDWSWVFLHSATEQWNSMPLKRYNDIMFDYAMKGIDPPTDLIILKVCCSHFINLVSRTIKANFSHFIVKKHENEKALTEEQKKKIKNLLLDSVGLLILCRSCEEIDEVFLNICKILLTPDQKDISDAMTALGSFQTKYSQKLSEQQNNINDGASGEKMELRASEQLYAKVMYKESQFYQYYSAKYCSEVSKVEKKLYSDEIMTDPTNIFFAPNFVEHLVTTWMPYVHLWTGIALDLVDPTISRVSNAYVESSTKVTKKLLNNHANSSIGDVVRKLDVERQKTAGVIEMDIHVKKTKAAASKPKYPEHISNPHLTEAWDPTTSADYTIKEKKSKPTHLNARTIKNEVKEFNTATCSDAYHVKKTAPKSIKKRRKIFEEEKKFTVGTEENQIKSIATSTRKKKRTVKFKKIKNKKPKREVCDAGVSQEKKKVKRKRSFSRTEENVSNHCKRIKPSSVNLNEIDKNCAPKDICSNPDMNNVKEIKEIQTALSSNFKSKESEVTQESVMIDDSSDDDLEVTALHASLNVNGNKNDGRKTSSPLDKQTQECETKIQWLQLHVEQYPNGIVKDAMYYLNSRSTNIVIACYYTPKFISMKTCQIRAREFSTVKEKVWINGLVIDSFVATHINQWTDVTYITTDDTSMILGEFSHRRISKDRTICKVSFNLSNILLMPYMYGSHWRLLAANIEEEKICVLDPYGNESDENRATEAFKKFVAFSESSFKVLKNIKWKKWIIKDRPYQEFEDGHSCGVLVINYAVTLGYRRPFDEKLDVNEYRKVISQTLLLLSKNMNNDCLHCGSPVKISFVTCHGCFRKCEEKCLYYNSVDTDEEDANNKKYPNHRKKGKQKDNNPPISGKFLCKLCKKYCK